MTLSPASMPGFAFSKSLDAIARPGDTARRKAVKMDWGSTVVGFGGVAVAGLSLWLNYRERSSSHRQIVYQKQVEAYSSVLFAMQNFIHAAYSYIGGGYESGEQIPDGLSAQFEEVLETYLKNLLFLSEPVAGKFKTFLAIWPSRFTGKKWPDNRLALVTDLNNAANDAMNAARVALGISAMSHEILDIVGKQVEKKART